MAADSKSAVQQTESLSYQPVSCNVLDFRFIRWLGRWVGLGLAADDDPNGKRAVGDRRTSRWPRQQPVTALVFSESYRAARQRIDFDRVGQHPGHLRSDCGRNGSTLDERTERHRRLDYRRIFHAPLLDAAAQTTRQL